MVTRLAREQAQLTKCIHLGQTPTATVPTPDKEGGMAEGPFKNMLRKIIKGTTPKRKARLVTPASSGTVSPKKKRLLPPTPTIQEKPPASRIPILKKEMSVGIFFLPHTIKYIINKNAKNYNK